MLKKISMLLAIVLLFGALFCLTSCNKEKYDFTALVGNTDGEVISNGGIAVIKGNYLYYINGTYNLSADVANKFGTIKEGAVLRILESDYAAIMQQQADQYALAQQTIDDSVAEAAQMIADAEGGTEEEQDQAEVNATALTTQAKIDADKIKADAVTASSAAIKEKTQVVVPKVVYSDKNNVGLSGIHIFGDRIYYTTPDVAPDKNGRIQNERLVLMSAKLDGTDTIAHYTFVNFNILSDSDSVLALCLTQVGQTPYAMFVEGTTLSTVDLTSNKVVATIENVNNCNYDKQNGRAIYTDAASNEVWFYVAGNSEGTRITEDASQTVIKSTYTISSIYNGTVYVTVAGALSSQNSVSMISFDSNNNPSVTKLRGYINSTTFLAYNTCTIYLDSNGTKISIFDTQDISDAENLKLLRTVALSEEDEDDDESDLALAFIQDDFLYFTNANKLYRIDLANIDWTAENLTVQDVSVLSPSSLWATYDICGDYLFNFSNASADLVVGDYTLKYYSLLSTREADFTDDSDDAVLVNISVYSAD